VRVIWKAAVLLLLGLTWAAGTSSVHIQPAAAATPPASEDTYASPSLVGQYGGGLGYPMGYPMNPYDSPYPTTPYGGMTSYPMSGYGTVMPSSGYRYPSGPGCAQYSATTGACVSYGASASPQAGTPQIVVTAPGGNAALGGSMVRIANFSFNPAAFTVTTGQAVTWTNAATVAHTTTSDTGTS
jgi:hypothetical protein